MSSYLSFYIVPKRKSQKEPKKHIILTAYSRSTEIYQYFDENIHPAFVGSSKETPYTTLTSEKVNCVLQDFDKDISAASSRLAEYEKYAPNNPDYIQEIIEQKEFINDLKYWRDKTSFIEDIVEDLNCYGEIEEVCCNID